MNWNSIKETVGKVAPLAGTLLGGPAGAAVGGLISSALGVENSPDAVAAALNDPDAVVKLKELESNERQHLLQMQLATLQAELADVHHARDSHKESKMPAFITICMTLICAGLMAGLFLVPIPPENKDILIQSYGAILALWAASVSYWVGTTRSSAEKTRMMAQ
jgi:hypothetical protein